MNVNKLITCKDCGNMYNKEIDKCPNCEESTFINIITNAYNDGKTEAKEFKPKIKNGNLILTDYRKMREEIYQKSLQLLNFDKYINSEKFDKDISNLIYGFTYDFGIKLSENDYINMKHEITSLIRGKYYGVK